MYYRGEELATTARGSGRGQRQDSCQADRWLTILCRSLNQWTPAVALRERHR